MKYAVLSPRNAPDAAAPTISGRFSSPADATTPAVITDVSLGTTGTSASRYASRKTIRYAQLEACDTRSVNWPKIAAYPSSQASAARPSLGKGRRLPGRTAALRDQASSSDRLALMLPGT